MLIFWLVPEFLLLFNPDLFDELIGWSILPVLKIGWDEVLLFIFLFILSVLLLFGNDIELNCELKLVTFEFVFEEYKLFKDVVFDDNGWIVFVVFVVFKFCWDIRELVAIELNRLDEIEVVEVDDIVPAVEEFGGGNDGIILLDEGVDIVEYELIDCVSEWTLFPARWFVEFNELRWFDDIGVIPPFVMKPDWTDEEDNFLLFVVEFY